MAITISGSGITSANIADGTIVNADINSSAAIDGSKLTDIETVTKSATAPSSPAQGDMWFDTTAGVNAMKVWSGSGWDALSNIPFSATGGTETTYTSGGVNYKVHTFTSSGTFTANASGSVDYLLVAGGGGTGGGTSGGGGAGGKISSTNVSVSASDYSVVIGSGGAGLPPYTNPASSDGTNTTFLGLTAIGGGNGSNNSEPSLGGYAAGSGGSGGGGSYYSGGYQSNTSGAAGTSGQGFAGGNVSGGGSAGGAGGGGAGGVGSNGAGSAGGVGVLNSLRTGSNQYYAGGGGGGADFPGAGGAGGGGNGVAGSSNGGSGSVNTGGGGGGGYAYASGNGGSGGSGIVIIRYAV
jgi:hypothetical protein